MILVSQVMTLKWTKEARLLISAQQLNALLWVVISMFSIWCFLLQAGNLKVRYCWKLRCKKAILEFGLFPLYHKSQFFQSIRFRFLVLHQTMSDKDWISRCLFVLLSLNSFRMISAQFIYTFSKETCYLRMDW